MRCAFGLFILCFLVAACTEKGKPYNVHEAAQDRSKSVVKATDPSPLGSTNSKSTSPLTTAELADRVLDSGRILNSNSLVSQIVLDELNAFNQRLLSEPDKKGSHFQAWLQRYQTALSLNCPDFADNCRSLIYFSRSPASAEVAKQLALTDSGHYFQWILVALSLKSESWDPQIGQMLLARPLGPTSVAEQKYKSAVHSALEIALQQAAEKTRDAHVARSFLQDSQAVRLFADKDWNLSGTPAGLALFTLIARADYLHTLDGKPNPDVKNLIQSIETDPMSVMVSQRKLMADSNFRKTQSEFQAIAGLEDLNLIIDGAFTGQISSAAAQVLFQNSRKSISELNQALRNYIRIQFFNELLDTTLVAKKLFSDPVGSNVFYSYFLRESGEIQKRWEGFLKRTEPLNALAVEAAHSQSASASETDSLKQIFDSLDHSIQLSSVYPQELMLFDRMAQRRFDITLMGKDQPASYDQDTLMAGLFEGNILPLLKYSKGGTPLNAYEVAYAFDFGVRTGLFESSGLDVDLFLARILNQLAQRPSVHVRNVLDRIDTIFSHSPNYQTLKDACEEFNSHQLIHRTIPLNEVLNSPYYGDLLSNAFEKIIVPESWVPSRKDERTNALFYTESSYTEALEEARLDLGNVIRLGNAMLNSYSQDLVNRQIPWTQIQARTQQSHKLLRQYTDLRERTLNDSLRWRKEIGSCYWKVYARNFEIQSQVLQAEESYLREVHRKMTQLHNPLLSDAERTSIAQSVRFHGLPNDFPGQDQMSADNYVYSQIDFLLRIRDYFRLGLKTANQSLPPLAPHLTLDPGTELNQFAPLVSRSRTDVLAYTESADEFVANGLRSLAHFDGGKSFLHWNVSENLNSADWGDTFKAMISLNRLEYELHGTQTAVPVTEILDTQDLILSVLNFSAYDRKLFQILHGYTKFPKPGALDFRILRTNADGMISEIWGVYDLPIRMMVSEELGKAWQAKEMISEKGSEPSSRAVRRQNYLNAATDYYLARSQSVRAQSVLPYNPVMDQWFDREVLSFVRKELTSIHEFRTALIERLQIRSQGPVDQRPHFDLNVSETITMPLTPLLFSDFDAKIRDLDQNTGGCFVTQPNCPDFATRP